MRATIENWLEPLLKHRQYKLLIIDELEYPPINPEDTKIFLKLIDMKYIKRSTTLTPNVCFKSWDEVFQDSKLANADERTKSSRHSWDIFVDNKNRLENTFYF